MSNVTNASGRTAVERIYLEHPDWTPQQIAEAAAVSQSHVNWCIARLLEQSEAEVKAKANAELRDLGIASPSCPPERITIVEQPDKPIRELAPAVTVEFPSRWFTGPVDTKAELDRLAEILVRGVEAVSGVFMRLCDLIRDCSLQDHEVRRILVKHFPQPRVSELMRVARAPDDVYIKYKAGFFGFKAALQQCRYYQITPTDELRRRQIKRAAHRLVDLAKEGEELEVRIGCKLVRVTG